MAQLMNTSSKAELMQKVEQQQRKIEQFLQRIQKLENELRNLRTEVKQKDRKNARLTESIEKLRKLPAHTPPSQTPPYKKVVQQKVEPKLPAHRSTPA